MSIYFFNTIYIALVSSFICVLFLYLISLISIQLYNSENVTYFIRVLSFSVPFFIINKVCVMVLNAQRKFNYLFLCNTVRVLVLIFSVLFLEDYYGLNALAISIVFSECALLLLFFFLLKKQFEVKKPNILIQKNILYFGLKAMAGGVLMDLSSKSSVLILGVFSTNFFVGVFAFALNIIELMEVLYSAISSASRPIIVKLFKEKKSIELKKLFDMLTRLSSLGYLIIIFFCSYFFDFYIKVIFPNELTFAESKASLFIMLLFVPFVFSVRTFGSAPTICISKPENTIRLSAVSLASNFSISSFLVFFVHGLGASFGRGLSDLIHLFYFSRLMVRFFNYSVLFKQLLFYSVFNFLMLFSIYYFKSNYELIILFLISLFLILLASLTIVNHKKEIQEIMRF